MTSVKPSPARTPRQPATVDVPATGRVVSFLLARIDDDETAVKRILRSSSDPRADEAHKLREECNAKREIIGTAQQLLMLRDLPHEQTVRAAARDILRSLTRPHAAHPACRPEWL